MPKVALCLYVKNEGAHIAEWIAYHYALGVDAFIIYDNDSTDETWSVIDRCRKIYNIKLISWPRRRKFSQLEAFDDCLQGFRFDFDWIGFLDADEFVHCHAGADIKDVLQSVGDASAVIMNWAMYGSSGHADVEDKPLIAQFLYRAHDTFSPNHHFKMFVRPLFARRVHTSHYIHTDGRIVFPDGQQFMPTYESVSRELHGYGIMRINHYFVRSRRHWEEKMRRGYTDGAARTWDQFDVCDRNEVFDDGALRLLLHVVAGLDMIRAVPATYRSPIPPEHHILPKDDPRFHDIPIEVRDIWTVFDDKLAALDHAWYRAEQNLPDWMTDADVAAHFERVGEPLGCSPNPYFDADFYRRSNADVRQANFPAFSHYKAGGVPETRRVNVDVASTLRRPPRVADSLLDEPTSVKQEVAALPLNSSPINKASAKVWTLRRREDVKTTSDLHGYGDSDA